MLDVIIFLEGDREAGILSSTWELNEFVEESIHEEEREFIREELHNSFSSIFGEYTKVLFSDEFK